MIKLSKYFAVLILFICVFLSAEAQKLEVFSRSNSNQEYVSESIKIYNDSLEIFSALQSRQLKDIGDGNAMAGYDSVLVDSICVKAWYTTGEKYRWKEIKLIADSSITEFYSFIPKKNDAFDYDKFFESSNKILLKLADSGYPFASIFLDSLSFSSDSVSAAINLLSGDKYVFDSIIIKGDAKIKAHYISKTCGFEKDELFSISKINKLDRQLKIIAFIEQSRPYQLAFADGKTDLILYLINKKASRFSGLIGIMPNNTTTGKLLITGDVNLNLLNSAGLGELFMFKWQKYEASSQNLKTEISVPYLFKSDFGVGLKFDIEKKDSSYLNTDFTGRILYGSNTGNGYELFFRRKSSYLLGDQQTSSNNSIAGYSTNLYGINYRYSNTDNLFNPKLGWIVQISTGFGTKSTDGEDNEEPITVFQTRNSLDICKYFPIGNFLSLKLRNYTASTYSVSLTDNELDFIGGLNTIRGFDELSLPASSYSIINFEFRYLFEEESALFVFYDAAYFEKRNTVNDYYNYAMGTGLGLDLNTTAGIFSLVFAIGKQNENPFQFNNSKIHFGYRNSF